ncbi:hypothetical protein CC80DRAFT_487755 [Byssothecium circinans]|uniref:Uncharacterized protein n=1 Tax=Byssothecium circinans TaxID=147558 RepID=A0A6A5UBF3_9PLEO|nr:hypothetical protein CC80DRAFT_487755 [Byssothecium circinans]
MPNVGPFHSCRLKPPSRVADRVPILWYCGIAVLGCSVLSVTLHKLQNQLVVVRDTKYYPSFLPSRTRQVPYCFSILRFIVPRSSFLRR